MMFDGYTGGGGKEIVGGLMSTGDVGRFDAGGRLFVDGRDDEMIVSGGENVFPREVEDLLADHAEIEEAAVVGVADEEFGQRLRAFVVPRDGRGAERGGGEGLREGRTSPASRCRARSCSWTSCRATRPARSLKRELAAATRRSARGGRSLAWRPMARVTDDFDLAGLRLSAGEGRRLQLEVTIEPLMLGSERYAAEPGNGAGGAGRLAHDGRRLRAAPALRGGGRGPVHALPEARRARSWRWRRARSTGRRRGSARSSTAPTCTRRRSTCAGWARDAFALAMPAKVLCREDCAGCARCARRTSTRPAPSTTTRALPDPRWAKLRELELE